MTIEYVVAGIVIALAIGVLIKLRFISKRISSEIRANLQERERRIMSLGTRIRDLEKELTEKSESIAADQGGSTQDVKGDSDPEHDNI